MNTIMFGKLPTEGDYIRVGSDRALLDFLDAWLTSAWSEFMLTAEDRWEEHYRVATLWWFAAPFEAGSVCGVICPSLDAVGRLFPIVVASRSTTSDALAALTSSTPWFDAVQEAVLQALEHPGQSASTLHARVNELSITTTPPPRRHVWLSGLQTSIEAESTAGWPALTGQPPIGGERAWSVWQAANFDGLATRALRLDGWPGAFALGVLLASDPTAPRPTPSASVTEQAESAVFRLEVAPGVPVFSPGTSNETPCTEPYLVQGSRGIAVLLPLAHSRLDPKHLPIAVRDLLGPIAKSSAQFQAAIEHLTDNVVAAAVFCKLDTRWALAEVGDGLSAEPVGSTCETAQAPAMRMRVWKRGTTPAIQINLVQDHDGDRRGMSALLGLRKNPQDRQRKIAMIEPA